MQTPDNIQANTTTLTQTSMTDTRHSSSMSYYWPRGAQTPGTMSPRQIKYVRLCLIGILWPSEWNLLHVTLQRPRILKWLKNFWKKNLCTPHFAHCSTYSGASDHSKWWRRRTKRLLTAGEDYCRNVKVAGTSGKQWADNIGLGRVFL